MCFRRGGGGLLFDHVANHEPLIAEVDVRWVEIPVICIGGKVRVSETLDCSSGAPELMFNPGASPAADQSIRGGVDMEEVFL